MAMQGGRVAAAALSFRNALPLMEMGWPVLVDLSRGEFPYPPSCVASSRAFVRNNPALVERFLKASLEGIRVIKKDSDLTERVFKKWHRETDTSLIKKTVEVYTPLFKPVPYVPEKGLDFVLKELSRSRPVRKEFLDSPDQFTVPISSEIMGRWRSWRAPAGSISFTNNLLGRPTTWSFHRSRACETPE